LFDRQVIEGIDLQFGAEDGAFAKPASRAKLHGTDYLMVDKIRQLKALQTEANGQPNGEKNMGQLFLAEKDPTLVAKGTHFG
jgi:hypothetical protein